MIDFDFDKLAKETLEVIGNTVSKQAKENMDKVSYGRTYIIGGKVHIASKKGDSPNNMTGAYRDTIRFEVNGKTMKFGAGNSKVNYVKYLEGGLDRPNIVKSIVQNTDKINMEVTQLFKKAIKAIK